MVRMFWQNLAKLLHTTSLLHLLWPATTSGDVYAGDVKTSGAMSARTHGTHGVTARRQPRSRGDLAPAKRNVAVPGARAGRPTAADGALTAPPRTSA